MRTKAILGSLGVATAGVLTVGAFAFAGPALADAGNDNLRASHRMELTDEQRQCLADAGVTRPEGRPTDEQREAMKAAAEGCGIEVPEPGEGRGPGGPGVELTDEQRQCLADAGVTRPEGRPTDEQREAMKAAAEGCGIEVPEPGEGRGPGGPGGSDGSGGSNHDGARGEGTTARQGAAS